MADVLELDAATGIVTERDFTPEEVAQRKADAAEHAKREKAEKADVKVRATARAALLDKLGITEDEAALLLSP